VNKISQTISRAFIGNRRTTEFDADIGNAMLLADECVSALCDAEQAMTRSASTGAVYLSELQELLPRLRALLKKLEANTHD